MGLAVLGTIVAIAIPIINPVAQIQKGSNAKREHNLLQIRNALDTYYNDNNKYPSVLSFGTDFVSGSTIYMKNVPRDPSCSPTGACSDDYIYLINPENPQWFVLFAKLQGQTSTIVNCPYLCEGSSIPTPIPQAYNFCVFGGVVDPSFCSAIAFTPTPTLPVGSPPPTSSPTPTPTPRPGASPTPTPTPTSTPIPTPTLAPGTPPPCLDGYYYYCACGAQGKTVCNYSYTAPPYLGIDYNCHINCKDEYGQDECGDPC